MERGQTYRKWRQDAPCYNAKEAWPARLFPNAVFHLFRDGGDLLTSLAIMLRHYGIEKEEDEENFNPWILNQKLIAGGAFNSGANLNLKEINRFYPLDFAGTMPYSRENLKAVWETGQPFLIVVPGIREARHFIVPDCLAEDDMTVIDHAWPRKYLREYEQILEIWVFWKSDEGMMYCIE